jgi:outer membrane protein TolC
MRPSNGIRRRWLDRLLTGVLFLGGTASLGAAEPLHTPAAVLVAPISGDLASLRHLALEQQPALAAYRASVAAANERLHGLEQLKLLSLVRRDLPIRREQAGQGIIVADARLAQATQETLYAVTRNYFSVLYARRQLQVAEEALSEDKDKFGLKYLRKFVKDFHDNPDVGSRRDVKQWNIDQIDVMIETTDARRIEAAHGLQRALAALREAVGVSADCPFALPVDGPLPPLPDLHLTACQVVELALARRGEIAQAQAGIEATALEVRAQSVMFLRPSAVTFAAGSDLHVQPIPQGLANGEYRPGAIGLEMPGTMTGHCSSRVAQAEELNSRAVSVLEKTRHLIALEAEDAFHKWEQNRLELERYRRAYELARKVADEVRNSFKTGADATNQRPTLDDLILTRVRAAQLQVQVNYAHYEALLALAALERTTGGGVCAGFDGAK